MRLSSSPASPFGRMIKIAAHVVGVMDQITVVATETSDPDDPVRKLNPLGKIPVLVADDMALYDSRVILEYLDHRAGGGKIIPADPARRFDVLTRNARINGVLDAAILVVYESRFRPEEMRVESFVEYQRDKIRRSLDAIAKDTAAYQNGAMPDIAEIGLACALDYLDFRKQLNWRDHCPEMEAWITSFAAATPGYHDTLPPEIDMAPWRVR